jgi:hypothetical protein
MVVADPTSPAADTVGAVDSDPEPASAELEENPSSVDADEPRGPAECTEDASAVPPDRHQEPKDPLRFSRWMKRSTAGAVMTGIAVGLREALEPRRPEVAVVVDADEPDAPDGPIDLRFDPESPQNTVAVIRMPPSDPETTP